MESFLNWHATVLTFSVLVSFAIAIFHYEVLGYLTTKMTQIKNVKRKHVLFSMLTLTMTHMVSVLLYASIYHLMINILKMGTLINTVSAAGVTFDHTRFEDLIYYSITVYTSLGFGDVVPTGGMRIISGLETLNGLILVAWSASFSYLVMSKYWTFKHTKRKLTFK